MKYVVYATAMNNCNPPFKLAKYEQLKDAVVEYDRQKAIVCPGREHEAWVISLDTNANFKAEVEKARSIYGIE